MRVLAAESDLSKAIFFSKARPASFLVLDVNATSLKAVSVLRGFKFLDYSLLLLTSLPVSTHLLHGRFVSQARCFFLQLTHAEGT